MSDSRTPQEIDLHFGIASPTHRHIYERQGFDSTFTISNPVESQTSGIKTLLTRLL